MNPRTFQYLAAACGGELRGGNAGAVVEGVCTDSRKVRPGDLFVAISGERFDGHDFLAEVAQRGALGGVVRRDQTSKLVNGFPAILVEDTRRAYGALGHRYRQDFNLPVVAVGGSNGKTTTKDFIGALLGCRGPVLKSLASYNNDLGVPCTLLELDAEHRSAVVEVGTNHPGELQPLLKMIDPTVGVITSIGREHLEFFGDLNGVIEEESEIARSLPPAESGGVLVLPGDEAWCEAMRRRTQARVVRVGYKASNDWKAESVSTDWSGTRFSVSGPSGRWDGEYRISMPGRHLVSNALLALAVASELGVEATAARAALANVSGPPHRLSVVSAGGVRILDDAYNANADSMLAALRTFSDLPCAGRRVAVLGEMAELGPHTQTAHGEIGQAARELGVDRVIGIGRWAQITTGAAGEPMSSAFADVSEAVAFLLSCVNPGDAILVKASRSHRLERVVDSLVRELNQREQQLTLETL